ncbi:DNA topoisomerase III [Mycoplasmatota bacterium]|nr:DNA topoisomerase III [Mycoplasmatota bacterium]
MKTLVLAEKPSVARDIAKVLSCKNNKNTFLEGDKYIVTWALGHLVTQAAPDSYDAKYKNWNMNHLPILPNRFKLEVINNTKRQYNAVKTQMLRNDVSEIVIATDAGREGELVARWIIEKAKVKKRIKRLWISSVTNKAIKEGFNNLKDGRAYENLYHSAVARSEADWVVGINATRALTCKHGASLSCGRVQTPTLSMIEERQKEISNFKPVPYYSIVIRTEKLDLIYKGNRIYDLEKCENLVNEINKKNNITVKVSKAFKKTYAPKLYDLTELQRDANRLFGFSAKDTLSIMQSLYEYHKVLTYPRTDSKYLSRDIVPTLKERVRACNVGNYSKSCEQILKTNIRESKSFVDDSKVSDHHAIIPTEQKIYLDDLNNDEFKIYDLVVKRFLSVLLPAFEYEQTKITAVFKGKEFAAIGKVVKKLGWKEVYSKSDLDEDDEVLVPALKDNDTIAVDDVFIDEFKTKPKAPFTEGTLLGVMENPIKFMGDTNKEFIKKIGEVGGIGTVATRADIIEKLLKNFLIEKRDNHLYITSKGKQLLNLAPTDLKSPLLTAKWEQKLSKISNGTLKKETFINEMKEYSKSLVNEIINSKTKFKHENITNKKCPKCGQFLLDVNGKQGKMLVCQNRECSYRESVFKVTNSRCPNCHKKLELHGTGDKQIFVCKCGHRESLSAFKKRKEASKSDLSKKDVQKYLKKQEREQKSNKHTPFANLLSKYKKD